MRRALTAFSTAFALSLLVANAPAQSGWRVMLSNDQAATLSPEALRLYNEAVEQVDRINYDEAVQLLARAAEIDSKNVPLQFLVASRARQRADVYYSEAAYTIPPANMDYTSPPWRTSEPYLSLAETALNRIATNPEAGNEDRERLKDGQVLVEARRAALSDRDKARYKSGTGVTDFYRETRTAALLKNSGNAEPDEYEKDVQNIIAAALGGKTKEAEAAAKDANADSKFDPFALLLGEYVAPFLPPPPRPQNQNIYAGQPGSGPVDPFAGGAPAGGANPFGDTTVSVGPPPEDGGAGGFK